MTDFASKVRAALWALTLVLSACAGALAAPDAAPVSINVSVTDDNGQPVADAQVEVRSSGKVVAGAHTDATGRAVLSAPAPGEYQLAVARTGHLSTTSALELAAGTSSQDVEVVLPRAELSRQKVDVQGAASSPVTETAGSQATVGGADIANTPSKPATLNDALPLIPGIIRTPDGRVSIAGMGETHSALLINSVDVTDPGTGAFGLSVPIDSVETISVAEMPYLAQYGRFTAGVVTAETRRGGDKWNFSLNDPLPEFRIRSGHVEGLRTASPRVNFSGPLIENKLYFLEGAEYALYKNEVRTLPFPENQTTSAAVNSFTQLDAIVSPQQTLTASFHFVPHTLDYAGLNFFNPQPVTPNALYHSSTGTLLDRLAMGGGVLQSTFALTRVSSEIRPQGTADMVLTPEGNAGNYFSQEARDSTRFEWIENWTPRTLHFAGDHVLQLGSVVDHSETAGQFLARPVFIQDSFGRLVQRVDFSGGSSFAVSDLEPAVYGQDHWMLRSNFALDAGLRLEAQTITHTVRAAPRMGFVWTPKADAKTVVRGGLGVFYDSVPLDVYAFGSYPQQTITTYNAAGAVVGAPQTFLNLTQQAAQSGFLFVERGRTSGNFAPYSVAWNLELERTVSRFFMVRIKYLQSLAQDLLVVAPQQVNGQNALVLESAGSARTRQFEFLARIGSDPQRRFFFSYVRQHARGDVNDAGSYLGDLPFPVVRPDLIASLPTEIPNRFLLWGNYALPHSFAAIPHVEWRNGFPFQPTNVFQQYVASASGPQYRFPRYFSLDMRISKDIKIDGGKHAVRLSGNIMNLTNHFNPLEVYSNIASPYYGAFFGNWNRHFTADFDFLY